MNNDLFPVAKAFNNELLTTKGERSYFYKLDSVDLEQMNELESNSFYNVLSRDLNKLSSSSFYKFYHLGCENYINTKLESRL